VRLRTHAMQRGAALVVGLIMLVLITIMLITALNLGTSSFRSVGNMQFRNEAIAAANVAIQERLSSEFKDVPASSESKVNVGGNEYVVEVTPICVAAEQVFTARKSSVKLGAAMSASPVWSTTWDIGAVVNDPRTGASVEVHAGSRVQLEDSDKQRSCP